MFIGEGGEGDWQGQSEDWQGDDNRVLDKEWEGCGMGVMGVEN